MKIHPDKIFSAIITATRHPIIPRHSLKFERAHSLSLPLMVKGRGQLGSSCLPIPAFPRIDVPES
jgi:hypothetical protein